MDWLCKLIRKEILNLQPYISARMTFDVEGTDYIKLDANESPFRTYGTAINLNQYPSKQDSRLLARICDLYQASTENVMLTRGMDESLDIITRAFLDKNDKMVANSPTFGFYEVAANIQGAGFVKVPLKERQIQGNIYEYVFSRQDILNACDDTTKIIVLCNPNNPTGNVISLEDIEYICGQRLGKSLIVVDEAYIEFSTCPSAVKILKNNPNLIVTKTLSKAYALAGARLGITIAHPEIISQLIKILQPYPISKPSIEACLQALSGVGIKKANDNIELIKSERQRVFDIIKTGNLIEKIYSTDTNFILIKATKSTEFLSKLKTYGIIARDRKSDGENMVRFSLGTPEQNDLLLSSLGLISLPHVLQRQSEVSRKTRETEIHIALNLDKKGNTSVNTGIGFFDHMLETLAKHSEISLNCVCKGDLHTGVHHTIEDVAITLGLAFKEALTQAPISRYGDAIVVMDEASCEVQIDICNRFYFKTEGNLKTLNLPNIEGEMFEHFFKSLSENMSINLHMKFNGENSHHIIEAGFKALGKALQKAIKPHNEILSTKGKI